MLEQAQLEREKVTGASVGGLLVTRVSVREEDICFSCYVKDLHLQSQW